MAVLILLPLSALRIDPVAELGTKKVVHNNPQRGNLVPETAKSTLDDAMNNMRLVTEPF